MHIYVNLVNRKDSVYNVNLQFTKYTQGFHCLVCLADYALCNTYTVFTKHTSQSLVDNKTGL